MSQVSQSMVIDSTKLIKSQPLEVRKMPPDSSSSLCNQLDSVLRNYRQFSNTTTINFPANAHRRLHISVVLLQVFGSCILIFPYIPSNLPTLM